MSCPSTTCLQYDGDIAGLGVRLSFYFQNFILVWLVARSPTDSEGALWTFIATSFGLTVSALVQVNSKNLTLLEGILVSQLSWLANLGTILALASYSRLKGKDNLVKIAAVVQGYLSMTLTIVMWRYAPNLPGVNCNESVQFVFMFAVHVPALGAGRTISLIFSTLMLATYSVVTFTECQVWLTNRNVSCGPEPPPELPEERPPQMLEAGVQRLRGGSGNRRTLLQRRYAERSKKIWLGFEADPIIFGILIAQIIVFTYFIVTTELIVTQKGAEVSDNNKWGFGQVLALTVVIPAGISLFTAFRTYGFRRILEHKPKQKHEQRRRHRVSHDFNNVELVRPPSRAQAPIRHYLEPRSSNLGGASSTSSTSTVEP